MRSVFSGDVIERDLTNILILLNQKGITTDELSGCAESMREVSRKVSTKLKVIDYCECNIGIAAAYWDGSACYGFKYDKVSFLIKSA